MKKSKKIKVNEIHLSHLDNGWTVRIEGRMDGTFMTNIYAVSTTNLMLKKLTKFLKRKDIL